MAQIFPRVSNALARAGIAGVAVVAGVAGWAVATLNTSTYNTGQRLVKKQPIPFSHEHHVTGLGLDCRYCHTSVETSSFAGIPPTATCMNCHKEIWKNAPMLEPVRESLRTGRPIEWNRVHDLPDFVYFDHSIHVAKGIGCASCHGRIDRMPLVAQASSLQMKWCLDCHRNPGPNLRPADRLFDSAWKPPASRAEREELAASLVKTYRVQSLTHCSACHR